MKSHGDATELNLRAPVYRVCSQVNLDPSYKMVLTKQGRDGNSLRQEEYWGPVSDLGFPGLINTKI